MARKTRKQLLEEALEAKGLVVKEIYYQHPTNSGAGREGGWTIEIDDEKSPVRGGDAIINELNYEKCLGEIAKLTVGLDYCPNCSCGIDHHEERLRYCSNCETSF